MNTWLAFTVCMLMASVAWAAPARVAYQGYLTDLNGTPVQAEKLLTFRLYDAAVQGHILWEEKIRVRLVNGKYAVVLGGINPLDENVLSSGLVFGAVVIDGEELLPRTPWLSVPYAIMAETSRNVAGGYVDATAIAIRGKVIIDENGHWVGPQAALPVCEEGDGLRFSAGRWVCSH